MSSFINGIIEAVIEKKKQQDKKEDQLRIDREGN